MGIELIAVVRWSVVRSQLSVALARCLSYRSCARQDGLAVGCRVGWNGPGPGVARLGCVVGPPVGGSSNFSFVAPAIDLMYSTRSISCSSVNWPLKLRMRGG